MKIETKEIYAVLTWLDDNTRVAYRIIGWENNEPLIVDEINLIKVKDMKDAQKLWHDYWFIAFGPLPDWCQNGQLLPPDGPLF